MKGGKREGAGRKPIDDQPRKAVKWRLTEAEKAFLMICLQKFRKINNWSK